MIQFEHIEIADYNQRTYQTRRDAIGWSTHVFKGDGRTSEDEEMSSLPCQNVSCL